MKLFRMFVRHPQLTQGRTAVWDKKAQRFTRQSIPYAEVVRLIKAAHVFVIDVGLDLTKTVPPDDEMTLLAPPFQTCWFELMIHDGKIPLMLAHDKDNNMISGPLGMLVHERSPGRYDLFLLEAFAKTNVPLNSIPPGITTVDASIKSSGISAFLDVSADELELPPAFALANHWLRFINDNTMAVEHTRETVLIPRPDRLHKRKPHVINQVVRILPKHVHRKNVLPLTQHGVIDWSHRWEVRGHWRHVKGLGKDRAGIYSVHGFTWVNNFVKGPEDKPLVVKTRVKLQPQEKEA